METVFSVLLVVSAFGGLLSGFWMLALPVGIVLAILKKLKKVNYRWRSILIWGFGGIGLFIASLLLFFILNLLAGLFNIPVEQLTLPKN